jgi:hypothetical protein
VRGRYVLLSVRFFARRDDSPLSAAFMYYYPFVSSRAAKNPQSAMWSHSTLPSRQGFLCELGGFA